MTYRCAVIIPTKNGMPDFEAVLSAVLAQKTPWPFEVIVIDSGSRDGTLDHVRAIQRSASSQDRPVRLIEIEPGDFGHGRTRNQAIAATEADYVALLTHDAEPLNEVWLLNLVASMEQDNRIAGVFGRHVARDDATPFLKEDLDRHFEGFLVHPLVVDRALDPEKYEVDIGWRQFLHFYSDNNSLMRRTVWQKLPYPDVEFAEDQIWARDMIEAGFAKAYAPDAVVIHSHDYGVVEQARRAFDEARQFRHHFGYRLSGSIRDVVLGIVRSVIDAIKHTPDHSRYGPVTSRLRLRRALQRIALVFGHFLGTHHEKLPIRVKRILSLDYQLFKS